MASKQVDYQALNDELQTILQTLQQEGLDVDTAMQAYERGLTIVAELESYLKQAENTVSKLQAAKGE